MIFRFWYKRLESQFTYIQTEQLQEESLSKSDFLIFIKSKNCRKKKSQVSKYI